MWPWCMCVQVHKVLEYLRRQDDDGDASTADSGRGTTAGDEPDFNNLYNGESSQYYLASGVGICAD